MNDRLIFTTRRGFLSGSLTFVSAAATAPLFLGQTTRALAAAEGATRRRDDSQRILVVIQLAGGNDGLNTVIPYGDEQYYKLRPRLAIPTDQVIALRDGIGLHPAAVGLKELYDEGRLAIVQGVGYPNPNRSHFTSTEVWHTADPELRRHEGWIGRYFDACCKGADPGPEPIEGVALTSEAPLAMQGERFRPLAFEDPSALAWKAPRRGDAAEAAFRKLHSDNASSDDENDALARYLRRSALEAVAGADEIRAAAGVELASARGRRGLLGGKGSLGESLSLVARMIRADLPTRVYYVSMGGFDTHTGQEFRHRRLMEEFGNAMNGFVAALSEDKLLDRVLVLCFSEFGRRVQENASGGTDHGEAAPMFLVGGAVRPGLHEKHPSLANLHRGDLPFACDFRRVYATVLRDWLKVNPRDVVGSHSSMSLLRA